MDYATKNTFTLRDLDGDATYLTGKGKSTQTLTETIYPTFAGGDWYYWDIHAGASDDLIDARQSTLNAFLYGDGGNDTIYGSTGYFNHIEGGDGNDLLDARLVGSLEAYPAGQTELLGGAGNDTLYGSWGEDFVDGGAGRDTIDTGAGDDWVMYDPNDIRVEADGGFDTIDASLASATNVRSGKGVTIDLSSNRDNLFSFEAIVGSQYNDTLTGDNANNRFDGGDGNDTIQAGGGSDFVYYDPEDTSVDGGFDWDTLSGEDMLSGMHLDMTTTHRNFEHVDGSRFDDIIKGDSNLNEIFGNDGDDVIDGGSGMDYISPGYGNDTWVYDAADQVYEEYSDYYGAPYSGGVDTIDASAAPASVVIDLSNYLYVGFENLIGSAWDDELTGNDRDNVIEGGAGADLINGNTHSHFGDTASYAGSAQAVTVNLDTGLCSGGDAEGDLLLNIRHLLGSQGDDVLTGNADSNALEGGAGADQLDGGGEDTSSVDYASYAGSQVGITASLADPGLNTGDAMGDSYSRINGLLGSSFDDILMGDDQANFIIDGLFSYASVADGATTVFGGGDDWIDGGLGDDLIWTGLGDDTVVFDAADTSVHDEGARDRYDNLINTFDTVDASAAVTGVTVDMSSNYAGFDMIIGSAYADTLTGNELDNVLQGGAGADSLNGGMAGGFDTASYAGSAAVMVDLNSAIATGGDAEGDSFSSIEGLIGSAYDDLLGGDASDNVIEGGAGADQINGRDGADTASYRSSAAAVSIDLGSGTNAGGDAEGDTFLSIENLIGSAYSDTLTGDTGDNRIEGAAGADVMDGGSGRDTFVYTSLSDSVEAQMDTISGFEWGEISGDVIDVSAPLRASYYSDLVYYTTAFADLDAIKAEAAEFMMYWAELFVATDGTDTYVFANLADGYPHEAGTDLITRLVGVNDLSMISADNFHTGGELYFYNAG